MEGAAPTAQLYWAHRKGSGTPCIATGGCGQNCKQVQKLVMSGPVEDPSQRVNLQVGHVQAAPARETYPFLFFIKKRTLTI